MTLIRLNPMALSCFRYSNNAIHLISEPVHMKYIINSKIEFSGFIIFGGANRVKSINFFGRFRHI